MRLAVELAQPRDRIGDDLVERRLLVDDAVDEGGVGAVLEQAAHEIGQQILVAADRGIDAARLTEAIGRALGADDLLVERLAHAVQPLELVVAARLPAISVMAARVCALWVANCG